MREHLICYLFGLHRKIVPLHLLPFSCMLVPFALRSAGLLLRSVIYHGPILGVHLLEISHTPTFMIFKQPMHDGSSQLQVVDLCCGNELMNRRPDM